MTVHLSLGSPSLGCPSLGFPSMLGGPLLADATPGEALLGVLLYVVVGVVLSAGVGAALAVLRVVLPGLSRAADRSLAGVTTKRLVLSGLLPLLGAALLARAVEALGDPTLGYVVGLLVLVPLILFVVLGAMAALPHLGERLLERGTPRSALARAVGGGLVVGLAATTIWVPPLFALVALLVGGWLLGIGLGAALGRAPIAPPPPLPPA
jgi:hypothetical protein